MTIAGVTTTQAFPLQVPRQQNVTHGRAADGSDKFFEFRSSDKPIVIALRGVTWSVIDSILDALEADADRIVALVPDASIDFGNGAGSSVQAKWLDILPTPQKSTPANFWDLDLNFRYVS